MKALLAVLAVAVLIPVVATGQSSPLSAGTRVRVTAPGNDLDQHVTTIMEVRGDSIVVGVRNSSLAIGLADVTELEISTGKRRHFWRGAAFGLGIGAVTGLVVGAVTYEECVPDGFLSCFMAPKSASASAAEGGLVLGSIGLLAGAVIGGLKRTDRWASVKLPVSAAIAPARAGGASVMLSRSF